VGPFWSQGHNLNYPYSGLTYDGIQQISKHFEFQQEDVLRFPYITLYKTDMPSGGPPFPPRCLIWTISVEVFMEFNLLNIFCLA